MTDVNSAPPPTDMSETLETAELRETAEPNPNAEGDEVTRLKNLVTQIIAVGLPMAVERLWEWITKRRKAG